MSFLAEHILQVKPSAVSLMSARALEMERRGRDILRLSAGEPDFPTPDHIKVACIKALCENKTKYPPVIGLPELRQAVCVKLNRDNDLDYSPEQVIVSSGAKQVLYNALAASLNSGDEVIIPSPYWMSYPAIVRLHRGSPVLAPTTPESGFKLGAEDLERAITPRTKWLILNTPGNPTGAVYSREDLAGLGEVLRRHPQVWTMCDDIYEHLVFDGLRFATLLNAAPDLRDRVLLVNGLSKTYSMPGWRLGYGVGPESLIQAMFKVQSQSTSGAATFVQWAAVEALLGDQSFIRARNEAFRERRDLMVALVNRVEGLACRPPQGAFYCYVSCRALLERKTREGRVIGKDEDLVSYFLDEVGVAAIHGAAFGLSPYFRLSFAASQEVIRQACERLEDARGRLK
ncbi:MAG: pyridoxal phosphate-dependent aminotransferase [Thermodesulfobacteriota bacterium]